MSAFFVSDYHFNHGNIIKYCNRPFLSQRDKEELEVRGSWDNPEFENYKISQEGVSMMNETLLEETNSLVRKTDTLYLLGDFGCFRNYEQAQTLRDRIRCQNIVFIWGNHDSHYFNRVFPVHFSLLEEKINGVHFVLCHYAMAVWNRSHRGSVHVYGHSHGNAEAWLNEMMPTRRSMDVGVDNAKTLLGAYRPFSFDEVMSLCNRQGHSIDHHR